MERQLNGLERKLDRLLASLDGDLEQEAGGAVEGQTTTSTATTAGGEKEQSTRGELAAKGGSIEDRTEKAWTRKDFRVTETERK